LAVVKATGLATVMGYSWLMATRTATAKGLSWPTGSGMLTGLNLDYKRLRVRRWDYRKATNLDYTMLTDSGSDCRTPMDSG